LYFSFRKTKLQIVSPFYRIIRFLELEVVLWQNKICLLFGSKVHKSSYRGVSREFRLGKQSQWAGIICPSGWDRVKISENLGKAAALPALPLITPLTYKLICFFQPATKNQLPNTKSGKASFDCRNLKKEKTTWLLLLLNCVNNKNFDWHLSFGSWYLLFSLRLMQQKKQLCMIQMVDKYQVNKKVLLQKIILTHCALGRCCAQFYTLRNKRNCC
jgi:hypothetical protein